ncbi:MAG TPA: helix-turn-helix domain-containing protein [Pseudonocardia sp.]
MDGSPKGQRGRPRTGVREAILRAATTLLVEEGAGRLTTAEVATRAGVAESSIFYHFADRIGLLIAIIQARAPEYLAVAEPLVERAGAGALRPNLVLLLAELERFYLDILPMIGAMLADARLRAEFARRGAELDAGPHRALELVLPYLTAERAAGAIRSDADPPSVALLLAGAAFQRALSRHLAGSPSALLPDYADVVALVAPMIEA